MSNIEILNNITGVIQSLENGIEIKGMYAATMYGCLSVLKHTAESINAEVQKELDAKQKQSQTKEKEQK
jgi:hypothetical protein